ncbi:MAG: L-seryl-tRNA(Sec) selenium transferase, partial [Pseudomonadota bacterium]
AGIIAGRKDLIKKIKSNPMKRALRVDKMTLAALEAVLRIYANPESLTKKIPALRLLTKSTAEIEAAAQALLEPMQNFVGSTHAVQIIDCKSQIGSGAQPVELLPSKAIAITSKTKRGGGKALEKLGAKFRQLEQPVIGRISDGQLQFDLRCLEKVEDLVAVLKTADQSP